MKKILLVLILFLAVGCQKEDAINAPLGKVKRNYDVNSSDPVLKYVSQYYNDYGKEFIIDPDSSDWLYNFQIKNKVKITPPTKDQAYILAGIKLMQELFVNAYPKDVIKEAFPYDLIIAEKIAVPGNLINNPDVPKDVFSSRNFIALNIGAVGTTFTEQQKVDISLLLHKEFFNNFLVLNHSDLLKLDDFYPLGAPYYGKIASKELKQDDLYKLGFVKDMKESYESKTKYPTFEFHIQSWAEFIMSTPQADVDVLIEKYPAMKTNYNAIMKGFKQSIKLDLTNLTYKAK